jgi:hypothetical protein
VHYGSKNSSLGHGGSVTRLRVGTGKAGSGKLQGKVAIITLWEK